MRTVIAILLLILAVFPAFGGGLGVSFSTNTFLPLDERSPYPVPPGLYGRAGLCWLPGNHLELEVTHVPRLTPEFYSQAYTGISVGWWLFQRKPRSYFNMAVDAGFLYGLDRTPLLTFRLVPIILGGPYYRYGDRLLAAGLVCDLDQDRFFLQLQIIGMSVYF